MRARKRVCAPDYPFSLSSHVTAATPCCSASCSSGVIMCAERTPFLVWRRPGRRCSAAAVWLCPRRNPASNISSSGFYPAYNTIKDSRLRIHIRFAVTHTRWPHDVTEHSLNSSIPADRASGRVAKASTPPSARSAAVATIPAPANLRVCACVRALQGARSHSKRKGIAITT